jgi:hypothetical protein
MAHGVESESQYDRHTDGSFVEKAMRAAKVLCTIPQRKPGPVRILGVPVEVATGRRPGIEEETEAGVPEDREGTQRRRHGGRERE